jgi:penicillin-binding protein 1C
MRRPRVLFVTAAVAGTILLLFFALVRSVPAPAFQEVRSAYGGSEATVLDRHHQVIHQLRVKHQGRRLDWVPLSEISPAFRSALVHAEDRRFQTHKGVDWISFGGALAGSFRSARYRGASTITMQLAAMLDEQLRARGHGRSAAQKWNQIRSALSLERSWSKNDILEAYVNLVTFRGELQGIAAAAKGLFEKNPHGLDDIESIILASLVRSPNAESDAVTRRAIALSESMGLRLEAAAIGFKAKAVLSRPYSVQPEVALAPHVALRLTGVKPGAAKLPRPQIVSTLDRDLQSFALGVLRHHLLSLRSQNVADAALLAVENRTGEVLAYVGNTGDQASAKYVDGVEALRQAGSTLKPFVYAAALERRYLTAASLIDDSPVDLPVAGGVYRPMNYDQRFHGLVTARAALASSLNVPAVKALNMIGVDAFVERLKALGFRKLRSAEFYGPSLALGSADVSLWDLVNAYRALANGGRVGPLRLTFDDQAGALQQAFSPEAAFLVSHILSDRESRSMTFQLESPLATRYWSAVKTGTSKDMRDNWCVGFSGRYTVGVWAGNFSGAPMWNVTGITGAAPVWVEIMNWLHRDGSSREPEAPPGVVCRDVEFSHSGRSRRECFIEGTETPVVQETAGSARFKIVYPASGTVIALDPDIPADQQKLFLEAEPRDDRLRWVLDGEVLGSAGSLLLWTPKVGPHTLALSDENERVLDSVVFQVRGRVNQLASK